VDFSGYAYNKEQLYVLVDAEAAILIYSLFKKKKDNGGAAVHGGMSFYDL
jgi:hypothetical protein